MTDLSEPLASILDLARWAPSGDNSQPWRFEIISETAFIIRGQDTRDWCVYDLDGRASQIAIGALMENIAIAASDKGLRADFVRRTDTPETQPTIDVRLAADPAVTSDTLSEQITRRTTQRRPLSTRPLSNADKQALEASVGPEYAVTWVEGSSSRWRMARLLSRNARIRLIIPEAYQVHSRIIEWDARYSEDRIPDQAVGLDPVGLKLMRWALGSWKRVSFLNNYLAGTWLPRLQLDLLPGYFCGAHFLLTRKQGLSSMDDYLAGGRAVQRFWLTASQLGLQFQPEMTPLIFARYLTESRPFTQDESARTAASGIAAELSELLAPARLADGVFMGRIAHGAEPAARSLRLPVQELLVR